MASQAQSAWERKVDDLTSDITNEIGEGFVAGCCGAGESELTTPFCQLGVNRSESTKCRNSIERKRARYGGVNKSEPWKLTPTLKPTRNNLSCRHSLSDTASGHAREKLLVGPCERETAGFRATAG